MQLKLAVQVVRGRTAEGRVVGRIRSYQSEGQRDARAEGLRGKKIAGKSTEIPAVLGCESISGQDTGDRIRLRLGSKLRC